MKKRDALWLLALPIYQIIGTIRHEGSHAFAAWLQGATITEFRFLPFIHGNYGFVWGLVNWTGGRVTPLATAAPYLVDLLFFALFGIVCGAIPRMPRWVWINCFIVGVVSPLIDTAYNYRGLFTGRYNDAVYLSHVYGTTVTHVLFATAIVSYVVGTTLVVMRWVNEHQQQTKEAPSLEPTHSQR
jgi:hypothetical protein